MISTDQVDQIRGSSVLGSDGDKIGSIGQVYLDDQSGEPAWLSVNTGFFGTSESFVPLSEASLDGDNVRVPYAKSQVKDAPHVDADEHLSVDQERQLYQHYGLDYDAAQSGAGGHGTTGDVGAAGVAGTAATAGTGTSADRAMDDRRRDVPDVGAGSADRETGQDTSGPNTDDAMTRSEERLNVGTQQRETGRARLRKYVVTENQTVNVPVSHEEARVEREPITDANRDQATSGRAFSDEEHEVVLEEERPVVSKEEVPVERVRLGKETVTGEEQVSEEVRKEQIEAEGDVRGARESDRE